MKAVITCASCRRSWHLDLNDSLYLQLDLSSRPCPHCEACTLSCQEKGAGDTARRPGRRRPHALAQPLGG